MRRDTDTKRTRAPASADPSHRRKLLTHLNGVFMSASPNFSRAPLTVGAVQLTGGVVLVAQKGTTGEPARPRAAARRAASFTALGSCEKGERKRGV